MQKYKNKVNTVEVIKIKDFSGIITFEYFGIKDGTFSL